jgi:hypothetical protein
MLHSAGYSTYLTSKTINGLIAQQQNGFMIVLEHRFYGLSNPYPDLTVKSLRFHTLQQAIDDLAYFAQMVHLPMPNGDQVTPDSAAWTLIGGSYSGTCLFMTLGWRMLNQKFCSIGALSSWTMVK